MASPSPDIAFSIGNKALILCIDHAAIHWFERHSGWSFMDIALHCNAVANGDELPKISLMGYAMQAGLRKHHPEITLDQAMQWAMDAEFMRALFEAMGESFPEPEPGPLAKAASPPPNRKSGTGTRKSARGAKRAKG